MRSRPARPLELASLACLTLGVAGYAAAFAAMDRLRTTAPADAGSVPFAGLQAWARYQRWSEASLALVALGLVAAVGAAVWTARARARARRAALTSPSAPAAP